jgi:hypothetical protein
VTELDLDDGVMFRSFRENAFWRYIDYAMADDFPTVNTDIAYCFKNEWGEETSEGLSRFLCKLISKQSPRGGIWRF